MFTLIKARYYNIDFKKRACVLIFLTCVILFVIASEYFRVDLSKIHSVHRSFSGKSRQSDFDWDGWVKKNDFLSVGDVYDTCDQNSEDRVKIGKTILSYNKKSGRIIATLVANVTLIDDMVDAKANIYLKYRGRTLLNETYDVCNDLAEDVEGLECPKKKGDIISVYKAKPVPSHLPKVIATLGDKGPSEFVKRDNGEVRGCVMLKMDILACPCYPTHEKVRNQYNFLENP